MPYCHLWQNLASCTDPQRFRPSTRQGIQSARPSLVSCERVSVSPPETLCKAVSHKKAEVRPTLVGLRLAYPSLRAPAVRGNWPVRPSDCGQNHGTRCDVAPRLGPKACALHGLARARHSVPSRECPFQPWLTRLCETSAQLFQSHVSCLMGKWRGEPWQILSHDKSLLLRLSTLGRPSLLYICPGV